MPPPKPVPTGSTPSARQRFLDRSRYIITCSSVYLNYVDADRDTAGRIARRAYLSGSVRQLRPGQLHVPRQHRAALDSSIRATPGRNRYDLPADSTPLPRYRVTVVYGREHVPWVDGVGRFFSP